MSDPLVKGQRWKCRGLSPAGDLFIEVRRVARDASWADIACYTWAIMWRKRQPLRRGRLPFKAERFDWDSSDLAMQAMAWKRAQG